ncbi:hypothetical protein BAE46_02675 [Glaciecola punicea]|nr:hypothetical protein BAE46_02675 [Glaciecola punicea]
MINVSQEVANFLSAQETRVLRLERQSLLLSSEKNAENKPLFNKGFIAKCQDLAQGFGGL